MQLNILPVCGKINSAHLLGTTVIVIDVLRATTNMVVAIQNGSNRLIPTSDAGEAAMLASRLGARDSVLAGERGGIRIQGFDIGNSPFEFSPEVVKGRTVIMNTTNGTAAVCSMSAARNILIGAMINCSAVARRAVQLGDDVLIVCAGTEGTISADDLCCAGAIAESICKQSRTPVETTDIVMVCRNLYRDFRDKRADLSKTFHWNRLVRLGFEKDVKFCFTEDTSTVVPCYRDGIIQEMR